VRVSLAPHAPYSVSPALFRAIREDIEAHPGDVSTVHVAESPDESEFIERGTGRWRTLLDDLGAWNPDWVVPGMSPVAYLAQGGFLDARVLAVHGVQCGAADVAILRQRGCTVVACPRSNRHVGAGDAPLAAYYEAGVPVAFGTDSLASAPDLNLFHELAAARRLAPSVPASRLLESATAVGARALGFGDDHGTIEPGKRADLIAIRVPEGVGDVEEYLLSGIDPADVTWLAR
jgi:cytosine/adenosine deaminase-related metal-dependent hydrolase